MVDPSRSCTSMRWPTHRVPAARRRAPASIGMDRIELMTRRSCHRSAAKGKLPYDGPVKLDATLARLPQVLWHRAWSTPTLGIVAIACGWSFFPIARSPGYALALAITPFCFLGGVLLATWLWGKPEGKIPLSRYGALGAGIASLLMPVPALLVVLGRDAWSGPLCAPLFGSAVVLSYGSISSLVGLGLGAAASARSRSPLRAWGTSMGWLAAWVAWDLIYLVREPPIFHFHPLVGYFAGPIYDQHIPFDARFLLARGIDILIAAVLLGVAVRRARASRGEIPRRPSLRAAAVTLAVGALLAARIPLGVRPTDASIRQELGSTMETESLRIHFDRDRTPPDWIDELATDLGWMHHRLTREFALPVPERPIDVFVYPSAAAKKQAVGAGRTSYQDPFRRDIHVHLDTPPPHDVVAHELVHRLALPLGLPLVGISPSIGLVEGLAAALADRPADHMTLHQQACALDILGIRPEIGDILGARGFWSSPGPRAYTTMGSFVRWLIETHGLEIFSRAYRSGDVASTYGRSVESLSGEWQGFLELVDVGDKDIAWARSRFHQLAIVDQPCGTTAARHKNRGDRLFREGDPISAAVAYKEATRLTQDGGATALRHARALQAAGLLGARDAWVRLEANVETTPTVRTWARIGKGDSAWKSHSPIEARQMWEAARDEAVSASARRRAELRLLAAASVDPNLAMATIVASAALDDTRSSTLARLAEEDDPTAAYLLGMAARRNGDATKAAHYLTIALARGVGERALASHARMHLARAHAQLGLYTEAMETATKNLAAAESAGEILRLRQELDRHRWAAQRASKGTVSTGS